MLPEAAALVVALALGEAKETARAEARAATAISNAARARIGLLPRKAPAKASTLYRAGRRVVPASGFAPTYLGEPGTLAEAAEPAPPPDTDRLALSVKGVTTDVTITMSFE